MSRSRTKIYTEAQMQKRCDAAYEQGRLHGISLGVTRAQREFADALRNIGLATRDDINEAIDNHVDWEHSGVDE